MSIEFINYNPKEHDLEKKIERTVDFATELSIVFPRATKFEDKKFHLAMYLHNPKANRIKTIIYLFVVSTFAN